VVVARSAALTSQDSMTARRAPLATSLVGMLQNALEGFSPWVEAIRSGVYALPARGPARMLGGEEAMAGRIRDAILGTTMQPYEGAIELDLGVGIADGLFAGFLAARHAGAPMAPGATAKVWLVPPGSSRAFLAGWPVEVLGRKKLALALYALGIKTLGDLAALPLGEVLTRFGVDGAACWRVAAGLEGDLPGFRQPAPKSRSQPVPAPSILSKQRRGANWVPKAHQNHISMSDLQPAIRQEGLWGEHDDGRALACASIARVEKLLGTGKVLRATMQGGWAPSERVTLVSWSTHYMPPGDSQCSLAKAIGCMPGDGVRSDRKGDGAPWPGRIPPPAPASVCSTPLASILLDTMGSQVAVTARGVLSATPAKVGVGVATRQGTGAFRARAWETVISWAGPWPADERWWSPFATRRARLQVLTRNGMAYLMAVERGQWWIEAIYD